ncbi:hypothetical protein [Pseudoalteromonas phage vB_PtuP_Slicky01]|nr:hypothetical protein [Pseudoalteromonas phage vB_PtuP_Slicky01]
MKHIDKIIAITAYVLVFIVVGIGVYQTYFIEDMKCYAYHIEMQESLQVLDVKGLKYLVQVAPNKARWIYAGQFQEMYCDTDIGAP